MKYLLFAVPVFLLVCGCASRGAFSRTEKISMEVTGYCKCQKCCGWERNLLMQPVYAYGPMKGQRKKIGETASGKQAKPGHTIAADTSLLPFGTRLKVPGYGWGVVEDRGGAITGRRLDLFFKSHKDALKWGRQTLTVEVVRP
ncbi:MAG: 3D domain-containing protein [Verrucomicrobiales bacterium]|nr:3D domain-containing protein [Verrucomicrobiales bacterium]